MQAGSPTGTVNMQDQTTGPRLDFQIKFATAGSYNVWLRLDGPNDKADSVHVGFDGAKPFTVVTNGRGMSDHSGNWTWVNTIDGGGAVKTTIAVGTRTLNVYMRENGVMVDKIVLTTSTGPTGNGPPESARQ
jgi:hypothetical protein